MTEINSIVQKMNPNYSDHQEAQKCMMIFSSDVLSAVDDPKDAISSRMFTTEMLNRRFNSDNKTLTHILKLLYVGDICYLMRTLGRETKSQQIKEYKFLNCEKLELIKVVVQTIENDDNSPGDSEVHYFIPRTRFRFTLPSGESLYEVTRTQFSHRLAYAVSINKSTGNCWYPQKSTNSPQP